MDQLPANRRENRPLRAQESRCPCLLGDRRGALQPAQLQVGGGIPQVVTCRRQPPPGAAGRDHFTLSPVGFVLADPFPTYGRRSLPGRPDPVAPVDHSMAPG